MDIIRDILDRIASALPAETFTDDIALQIETQIRHDWGGDRPYIAKAGESSADVMSRRNAAILRDWQNGERIPAIARKHRLSRVRVWQIVKDVGG
jgi:Mor family transcriptional regulator